MSWYILIDREICTQYFDAVQFFQILICCLFSAYYYIMLLGDFRPTFLYEFKLSQSAAETTRKIKQVFGNDGVNERTVRRWFAKFRSGDFSLKDDPRSGRSTVT